MKKWKIFYGDGSTFGSDDGIPEEAPALNVQAIAHEADIGIGRRVVSGKDYYWWEPRSGQWEGTTDPFALWDYLVRECPSIVKFGRVLPRLEFEKILHRAVMDSGLQPKVAWDSSERQPLVDPLS